MPRAKKSNKESNARDILTGKRYSKSNALVNAKGKTSLLGQKLFAVGIQQAERDEKTGRLVSTLYGTDLRAIFGNKSGSFYDQIRELVEPIKGKPSFMDWRVVYTDDASQSIEAINVITDCKFENGVLTIKYNDSIADQIYELKSNYTVYSLEETIPLKSLYSFRIYEILKSEYDLQSHRTKRMGMSVDPNKAFVLEMDLTDLKLRLGIIDPTTNKDILKAIKQTNPDYDYIEELSKDQKENLKYIKYSNFKRLALDRAKKELAEKTLLSFDYDEIKNGRGGKVVGIRFYIKFHKKDYVEDTKKVLTEEDKDNALEEIMEIIDEKLKLREYKSIAEAAGYDVDLVRKQYAAIQNKSTDIKNLVGYLIEAVREDYEEPSIKRAKSNNSFNQFKQNSYDFDELEKQLLDN